MDCRWAQRLYNNGQLFDVSSSLYEQNHCVSCRHACILFTTLNNGTERNISANTHPAAHVSMPGPYFELPHNNSGALYHRLATFKIISLLRKWLVESTFKTDYLRWITLISISLIKYTGQTEISNFQLIITVNQKIGRFYVLRLNDKNRYHGCQFEMWRCPFVL